MKNSTSRCTRSKSASKSRRMNSSLFLPYFWSLGDLMASADLLKDWYKVESLLTLI